MYGRGVTALPIITQDLVLRKEPLPERSAGSGKTGSLKVGTAFASVEGMNSDLKDKTVAILLSDGFESIELMEPLAALHNAGASTVIVGLEAGKVSAHEHGEPKGEIEADAAVKEVDPGRFDALFIPGGTTNGKNLEQSESAAAFVRHFFEAGKPVGAICHGAQVFLPARVAGGREMTSHPDLRERLSEAGAHWVDEEVVVDQGLVTSRKPDDLPAFCFKLVEEIHEGIHAGQRA